MQRQMLKHSKNRISTSKFSKYGAIFLVLLLSIIIAACGAANNNTTTANAAATPKATVTQINLNPNLQPTPAMPQFTCGIWVTNASPIYSSANLPVYAQFSQNDNGNPKGIVGAAVTLNVQWGDGQTIPQSQVTSTGGLATFYLPMGQHPLAQNKLSLM